MHGVMVDEILIQLRNRYFFTPDWKDINEYEKILFFTDGVLRKQFSKHQVWLPDAEWIGEAITTVSKFIQKRTADTPIMFEEKTSALSDNVWGDVWAITPEQLHALDVNLDTYERFDRKKVYVKLIDQLAPYKQGKMHPIVQAYTYLGRPEFWENHQMVYSSHLVSGKNNGWIWDPRVPITT